MTETQYLNVDLEVASRRDLAPLLASVEPDLIVLHTWRQGRLYHASFELLRFRRGKTADACIAELSRVLAALPAPARRLWTGATKRCFHIGIEAGTKAGAWTTRIGPATLQSVVELGGTLALTIYPPERRRKAKAP